MPKPPTDLREHLVRARLAGDVQTSPGHVRENCRKLVDGDDRYTFGLNDWRDADIEEAVDAVRSLCGDDAVDRAPDGPGWIDPDAAADAIARHGEVLAEHAAAGSRVLVATGHPTGLLAHYIRLADALADAGCELLRPLDDAKVTDEDGQRRGVRFVAGVGCIWTGGDLVHSHRSVYAEQMLDALIEGEGPPGLVVGDHGMAGAAVERGIETLSIADVNDPALMLARARGRTDLVLPIDDNLVPSAFEPVTATMLNAIE